MYAAVGRSAFTYDYNRSDTNAIFLGFVLPISYNQNTYFTAKNFVIFDDLSFFTGLFFVGGGALLVGFR